jgi:predicted alpha/beta-fold hydrolase
MPLIPSAYASPYLWPNGDFETIYPSMFREVDGVFYERERIQTEDKDFLDLDWSTIQSNRLLIVSHGLEGNAHRPYVKGFVKYFNRMGWDVLAWNCRSCSGEMNLTPRLYHHGAWYDLNDVVQHVNAVKEYSQIGLAGISMGGSITLRYLAELGEALPGNIAGGVAISVPCSLPDSIRALERPGRRFYARRFIKKLKAKLLEKAERFPHLADIDALRDAGSFAALDTAYSIHVYGFSNVKQFYEHISVEHHLPRIQRDVLIVNAKNDPMLINNCYPVRLAESSKNLFLEMPEKGGHMGFALPKNENAWAEIRTHEFFRQLLGSS